MNNLKRIAITAQASGVLAILASMITPFYYVDEKFYTLFFALVFLLVGIGIDIAISTVTAIKNNAENKMIAAEIQLVKAIKRG